MSISTTTGICPKCDRKVKEIHVKVVPGITTKDEIVGLIICCPHCDAIFGAEVDPILLANFRLPPSTPHK